MTPKTLDAQVRRLRTGKVCTPSYDPDSAAWSRMLVPVMSMAAAALDNQIERLDRFSLPLLPPYTSDVRASPPRTARLFLQQLRSDYRRIAGGNIDLIWVENSRKSDEWARALNRARVKNRPVAILALGRYLASDGATDLVTALKDWVDEYPDAAAYVSSFGSVIGPMVQLALDGGLEQLPPWANTVGDQWCSDFLEAGAQELRRTNEQPAEAPFPTVTA